MNSDIREVLEQAEGKSLVERLGRKWATLERAPDNDARWWLNAIAEELETEAEKYVADEGSGAWAMVEWLREQASK